MSTTVIITIGMQGSKRGEGSKKQQSRLPVIAPKDDGSSSASSSRSTTNNTGAPVPSRTRLPPRSRTGCWTCRTRKVKCDEGRPVCGQCSRLGHTCDYSPRLSFRDDTPRIVERMHDVFKLGSSVWDSASPVLPDGMGGSSRTEDTLPPFAMLTTDEDRERKAESQSPGTFHVVVNPDSFAHLPEYTEELVGSPTLLSARRGSLAQSLTSSLGREHSAESILPTEDPNTVIVSKFEDVSRRPTTNSMTSRLSDSPILLRPQSTFDTEYSSVSNEEVSSVQQSLATQSLQPPPTVVVRTTEPDTSLLNHFRRRVWPQLAELESGATDPDRPAYPGEDLIEQIAAVFPPCYHALMAVAATSLAQQNGEQRLGALQHYQQVLPALQKTLRSADDLSSDGTFLTHFLLLVYEIVAAGTGGSNLWSQHLVQLLRISLMRWDVLGGERYPFITWWICHIDLEALFSGAGSGDFFEAMLNKDMMPPPGFHLCPMGLDGSSIIYREETDTMPLLLQLNYDVTVLAGRLGLLARELREETSASAFANNNMATTSRPADTKVRQSRISEIQEALRHLWVAPNIGHLKQSMDLLPPRSRRVLEHAQSLYRACLIYSHTSMWSTQRMDTGLEYEPEIAISVQEILQTAEGIVSSNRLECRFIVFPLFMAGFASGMGTEKIMALDLLTSMEKDSIGTNTTATRHVLQIVLERQTQRFMSAGHSLDVNWMDVMVEQGLQVVNFGL